MKTPLNYCGILTRRSATRLVAAVFTMGVAGLATGCGEGVHSAGTMVKDPEPLPPEETTEAMLQSKAKTKKGRRR